MTCPPDIGWLIRLRWIAIIGQCAALLLATTALSMTLPTNALLLVVAVGFGSNAALWLGARSGRTFSQLKTGLILLLDTTLLAAFLYWSGGSSNPFSTLFLVHITMAAVVLGAGWTWFLAGYATVCFSLLFFFAVPLPGLTHHEIGAPGDPYSLHLVGMLIAFALTAALITYFLTKITGQIRAFEQERSSQYRLAALATLSAGAAHELGSPLATIAVASSELKHSIEARGDADTHILQMLSALCQSVERCKQIIERMSGRLAASEEEVAPITVSELTERASASLECAQRARLEVRLDAACSPLEGHHAMLEASLKEMLKNSFDASGPSSPVLLEASRKGEYVAISVRDFGRGMRPEDVSRAVEPFFTTKEPGKGMGLGLYIIDLFAKSMGGSFTIESRHGHGTTSTLYLPRTRLYRVRARDAA